MNKRFVLQSAIASVLAIGAVSMGGSVMPPKQ